LCRFVIIFGAPSFSAESEIRGSMASATRVVQLVLLLLLLLMVVVVLPPLLAAWRRRQ